jgi:serine/threonine-protein kinase
MMSKLVLAFVCVLPAVAWSQASPQAEALFRDGKQLMKDGKLAEACAAFEGSERAEHNIATVLSLADCREKNHQYASAWASFLQAESQTRNDPAKQQLNTTAKTRAIALEPKLSYLTITVPDESRIPELVVTRDGTPVDAAEWNRAIPVDGGSHVIAGKAPGHEPWSTTVTVGEVTDKQAVEVPKFKELPKLVHVDGNAPPEPSPFTARRKVAIGLAAGGVVAAGVAVGFGLDARGLRDEALSTCPPSACSVADAAAAQSKNDRARSRALVANVGFGVAGAAVAAGAVLWFLSPPERAVTLVPQPGGVAVVGRF